MGEFTKAHREAILREWKRERWRKSKPTPNTRRGLIRWLLVNLSANISTMLFLTKLRAKLLISTVIRGPVRSMGRDSFIAGLRGFRWCLGSYSLRLLLYLRLGRKLAWLGRILYANSKPITGSTLMFGLSKLASFTACDITIYYYMGQRGYQLKPSVFMPLRQVSEKGFTSRLYMIEAAHSIMCQNHLRMLLKKSGYQTLLPEVGEELHVLEICQAGNRSWNGCPP